jgi:prepilin-type N-terminal cleavage/methylation domain-containing protein
MKTRSSGFTLVEMLVVVVVIMILAGIVLRLGTAVQYRMKVANTTKQLSGLSAALEEYFSEYAHYPAVDFVKYEFESRTNQPPSFKNLFLPNYTKKYNDQLPPKAEFTPWFGDGPVKDGGAAEDDMNLGYKYGLYAHLYSRITGDQWIWFNNDTAKDSAAKSRWAHFLAGVPTSEKQPVRRTNTFFGQGVVYSNMVSTILDDWGTEIMYRSPPPYNSYILRSPGPNRNFFDNDDVVVEGAH